MSKFLDFRRDCVGFDEISGKLSEVETCLRIRSSGRLGKPTSSLEEDAGAGMVDIRDHMLSSKKSSSSSSSVMSAQFGWSG